MSDARCVAVAPTLALAASHYRAGHFAAAEAVCRHLIGIDADRADAAHLLGVLLLERDAPAEAQIWLRLSVELADSNAQAWDNLGRACLGAERPRDAIAAFETVMRRAGASAERLVNLGNALLNAGDVEAAIEKFRTALILEPLLPQARFNLARALQRLGRSAEAEAELRPVLPLAPPDKQGIVIDLLAHSLSAQGRYQEAVALLSEHLANHPDAYSTRWNRALAHLTLGAFGPGWLDYECRWLVDTHTPAPDRHAVLDVTQVAGQRVLIVAEQGMGDCIQFARYGPLLGARGAEVWLSVPRELVWVCRTLSGVRGVVATGDPVPPPDLVVSMLSLPLAFGTRLESIPASARYLAVPPHARAVWAGRVRVGAGPQIGIVWVGSAFSAERASVGLSLLGPLLMGPRAVFHAVVRDVSSEDDALLRTMPDIRRYDGLIHDFADSAAILAQLDLVITIDTALAHLAGALGIPVWVMLPFDPDWRWLIGRDDSPWYPRMRLFRQAEPGDWSDVIERVRVALVHFLSDDDHTLYG